MITASVRVVVSSAVRSLARAYASALLMFMLTSPAATDI